MKARDIEAEMSAIASKTPVLVRVRDADGTERLHAIHSIDEEEGSEGLIAVVTLGPVVTP